MRSIRIVKFLQVLGTSIPRGKIVGVSCVTQLVLRGRMDDCRPVWRGGFRFARLARPRLTCLLGHACLCLFTGLGIGVGLS